MRSALSGVAGRAIMFDDDAFSERWWPPLVEYNFAPVDESASFVDKFVWIEERAAAWHAGATEHAGCGVVADD